MHVKDSVGCLVYSKCPVEALSITMMQKMSPHFTCTPFFTPVFFLFQERGGRRWREGKGKHKHSDLEGNLCFEADKHN